MVSKVSMAVNLGGIRMKNPVNTASGTFGHAWQFEGFYDVARLGAVTCKGVAAEPWPGNPAPRVCEVSSGTLNSAGPREPWRPRLCRAVRRLPGRACFAWVRRDRAGCGPLGGRVLPFGGASRRGGTVGGGHRGQHLLSQPRARRPPAWRHARGRFRSCLCRATSHKEAATREAGSRPRWRDRPRLRGLLVRTRSRWSTP